MQITCPKCKKQLTIPLDKLPADKEKAMIKCPGCQQIISFNIPKSTTAPTSIPRADKTMIDDAFSGKKAAQQVKLTDENTGIQYLLKPGRNTLGRKADISIEEDLFLSRIHCMIELIERNGVTEAILSDDGKGSPSGEPSKNGTCYNGELLTIYDQIMLNDGDHIKIGHTELGVTFN